MFSNQRNQFLDFDDFEDDSLPNRQEQSNLDTEELPEGSVVFDILMEVV